MQGDLWKVLADLSFKGPVSIDSEAQQTIDSFKAIGWQNIATIMIATESIKSHTRKRAQPRKIFPKSTKDSFQFTDIKTLFV
jgi:hypothetical protein